ncbi:MAG: HEAT repeat domain-containing protein [Planctomycetes bacterium]|nr:HEAT repeat domain-containing protein [Planctomycetota bacterium]
MNPKADGPPRTPAFIWVLGLLVVVAVWLAWQRYQTGGRDELERWQSQPLDLEAIRVGLDQPERARRGHALVQFAMRVGERRAAKTSQSDLVPFFKPVAAQLSSNDREIRNLAIMALAYLQAPGVEAAVRPLLQDSDPNVALNAALALAARGDPRGAPLIAEALAGTRLDQTQARYELLRALAPVTGPDQKSLLQSQLDRAQLDRDEALAQLCRQTLERLD